MDICYTSHSAIEVFYHFTKTVDDISVVGIARSQNQIIEWIQFNLVNEPHTSHHLANVIGSFVLAKYIRINYTEYNHPNTTLFVSSEK
jgi:hypothetical protein